VNTNGQLSASPSASTRADSREVDELARGLRDTDLNSDQRVPKEVREQPEVKVVKQSRRETNAENSRRALIENAEIKGKGTVSSRCVRVSTTETRDSSVMDQESRTHTAGGSGGGARRRGRRSRRCERRRLEERARGAREGRTSNGELTLTKTLIRRSRVWSGVRGARRVNHSERRSSDAVSKRATRLVSE
jgi:hypothetical protein